MPFFILGIWWYVRPDIGTLVIDESYGIKLFLI
jgi:hypothetical protein